MRVSSKRGGTTHKERRWGRHQGFDECKEKRKEGLMKRAATVQNGGLKQRPPLCATSRSRLSHLPPLLPDFLVYFIVAFIRCLPNVYLRSTLIRMHEIGVDWDNDSIFNHLAFGSFQMYFISDGFRTSTWHICSIISLLPWIRSKYASHQTVRSLTIKSCWIEWNRKEWIRINCDWVANQTKLRVINFTPVFSPKRI